MRAVLALGLALATSMAGCVQAGVPERWNIAAATVKNGCAPDDGPEILINFDLQTQNVPTHVRVGLYNQPYRALISGHRDIAVNVGVTRGSNWSEFPGHLTLSGPAAMKVGARWDGSVSWSDQSGAHSQAFTGIYAVSNEICG